MKTLYLKISLLFLVLVSVEKGALANSDVVLNAMEDELHRSMKELTYKDYKSPFFIEYKLIDNYSAKVRSKLGAVIKSDEKESRNNSVRLMVGDYEITDENWLDRTSRVRHHDGYIPVPLENDYDGIRRSFWIMTNNIYKSAAEKYRNKITAIEQKSMTSKDFPAPDFSRAPTLEYIKKPFSRDASLQELELLSKYVSNVFVKAPDVIDSEVIIEVQNLMRYFINSEGTKTVIPFRIYKVEVSASVYSKENNLIKESLSYLGKSFSDIPSKEILLSDAQILIENIRAKQQADQYKESYLGPVLFKGQTVSEIHLQKLFRMGEGLIAQRINMEKLSKGISFQNLKTWEEKKGRKVIDSKLSVVSMPGLKTYNKVQLLGSFDVDLQGVKPVDSLVLVDKGKLINQLNDRIPTPSQRTSNGHMRFYFKKTFNQEKKGPDVILVNASETITSSELDVRFMEIAKEEDLDYVFEVSSLVTHANVGPINYYKIDVKTGVKTLMRSVQFEPSGWELRKIEGVSSKHQVVNTLIPDIGSYEKRKSRYASYPPEILAQIGIGETLPIEGTPSSIICPEAMLFEMIELNGTSNTVHEEKTIVPYHLAVD